MARITEDQADKYQNTLNGEWFSLKNDKDVARVQFMLDEFGDLDVFACHKVKVNEKDRYVDCLRSYDEPIDNCPFCAAGIPVKPVRFVIMYQHDDSKVKIWERGKNFIAKIQSLCNRYSPLSEYVFEIERIGKAGSKDTRYEIYPMDRVDPVDMSEVEKPELLGGLILDKSAEEMDEYLETGEFPAADEDVQPVRRNRETSSHQAPARRAPARQQQDEPKPAPRGEGMRRRGTAASEAQPSRGPSRGPARGSRRIQKTDEEVF